MMVRKDVSAEVEKGRLVNRLLGCARRINAYYPRPINEPITAGEESVRAEAREIEARLRELNETNKDTPA